MAKVGSHGREILRASHPSLGELAICENGWLHKPLEGKWTMNRGLRERFGHLVQAHKVLKAEGWKFTHVNGEVISQ